MARGDFSPGEPDRYRGLVDSLLYRDPYLLLADFAAYVAEQQRVDRLFQAPDAWADKAIRNSAGMGAFSADRHDPRLRALIWNVPV